MHNSFQYYPTPRKLAARAWAMFKNRKFVRVLEPQAGDGHLALAAPFLADTYSRRYSETKIDCCEIDIARHAKLRGKGFNVVGTDFLSFTDGAIYSHCILNPPFALGARHVLKAWDILWDGEIVAIINAESYENPLSHERQRLKSLIDEHGEIEFIDDAFMVPDAERKTPVRIGLVWLRKKADVNQSILGDLLSDLASEAANAGQRIGGEFEAPQEVALPNTVIENTVRAFNAAVRTMKESVFGEARARYYAALLGETMAVRNGTHDREDSAQSAKESTTVWVQRSVAERYDALKDRAWAGILRGSQVTERLSSAAQKRVESEFEQIKKLEFTVSNVYGFLAGIAASQGEIQLQMALDIFDLITKYHSDNACWYMGWRSNDRHRTCGWRIRTTRFILPRNSCYSTSLDWDAMQKLRDIDRVFAMLDGRTKPEVGIADIFETRFMDLKHGERVSSSYFDCRYFPGIGTIHFFPTNKKLVDRLNRLVGRSRAWIPEDNQKGAEGFWTQYEKADNFEKELRTEVGKNRSSRYGRDPFWYLTARDDDERKSAEHEVTAALETVLERHGISTDFRLASQEAPAIVALPAPANQTHPSQQLDLLAA